VSCGSNSAQQAGVGPTLCLTEQVSVLGKYVSGALPWQLADPVDQPYIRWALGHASLRGHWVTNPGSRGPNLPTTDVKLSNLWNTFYNYPDDAFQREMRVSRELAHYILDGVVEAGCFKDNMCRHKLYRIPASYQVFTAMWYMAHGGNLAVHAKAAHVSRSLICRWLHHFGAAVNKVFSPRYMRPPQSAADIATIQAGFESRRGMSNVGLAIDGTHIGDLNCARAAADCACCCAAALGVGVVSRRGRSPAWGMTPAGRVELGSERTEGPGRFEGGRGGRPVARLRGRFVDPGTFGHVGMPKKEGRKEGRGGEEGRKEVEKL